MAEFEALQGIFTFGFVAMVCLSTLLISVSWYIIIRSGGKTGFSFVRLYKFTVTGFALNYVTSCWLMGGEPYRIMELKPYIGIERATSSVILYVMMHIFPTFAFG